MPAADSVECGHLDVPVRRGPGATVAALDRIPRDLTWTEARRQCDAFSLGRTGSSLPCRLSKRMRAEPDRAHSTQISPQRKNRISPAVWTPEH